jgi:hypothetical protein
MSGLCLLALFAPLTASAFTAAETKEIQAIVEKQQKDQKTNQETEASNRCKMPAWRVLLSKPLSFNLEAFRTNKALVQEKDNTTEKFSFSPKDTDVFNMTMKYEVPLSSLLYAAQSRPDPEPSFLTKAISLFAEGSYGNTVGAENSSGTYTMKVENAKSYKYGVKISFKIDSFFTPQMENKEGKWEIKNYYAEDKYFK